MKAPEKQDGVFSIFYFKIKKKDLNLTMLPLKTGDILLCHAGNEPWPLSWFAELIRYFTHSPFSPPSF